MAIFNSPYSTFIGKQFYMKDTEKEIRDSITMRHPWCQVDLNKMVVTIYPNGIVTKFNHPVLVEYKPGTYLVAFDASPFCRATPDGEFHVQNKTLFTLQSLRANLTSSLVNEGSGPIKSLSGNCSRTYSDVIANAMAISFNLNAEEVTIVKCLSAWFYHCLLGDGREIGDLEYQTLIARMSRETSIPATFLTRYVENIQITSLEEFLDVVKDKIENPNVRKMNMGVFLAAVTRSVNSYQWVGLDKQEVMAIALEHIPTFIALLVISLTEQTFRNTGLTKLAQRNFGRDKNNFILAVNGIVNQG